jgi:hypothetical protein
MLRQHSHRMTKSDSFWEEHLGARSPQEAGHADIATGRGGFSLLPFLKVLTLLI